jgi:sulfotransferase family protein
MKVSFVIGGTQKGGTSALASFLRQHPQICMPADRKELHFFDREEKFRKKPDYRAYHSSFRPEKGQTVIGEATPIYMYWSAAPPRIWSYNPSMKWIVILRDPAERAFSAWNMEKQRGREKLSFEKAVEKEAARCREALPLQHRVYSYGDRGFYAAQLRRLFNIFGSEQCLVLLNEDLRNHHQKTLRDVFRFLEVDDSFAPAAAEIFHHEPGQLPPGATIDKLRQMFYFDIREVEGLVQRELKAWYPRK